MIDCYGCWDSQGMVELKVECWKLKVAIVCFKTLVLELYYIYFFTKLFKGFCCGEDQIFKVIMAKFVKHTLGP